MIAQTDLSEITASLSSSADASSSSSSSSSTSSSSSSSSSSTSFASSSPSPDSQAQTSTTSPGTPVATGTSVPKSNNTNIGAAVGAPVAVVSTAFIVLLLWFLRYRRRTNAKLKDLQEELAAREQYIAKAQQLPGQLPFMAEMSAKERTHELGAGASHELPVGVAS